MVDLEEKVATRAIVIFDSRYGNTEKIARSLTDGLKEAGIDAYCLNENDVQMDSLKEFDLIAVGGPTEALRVSKSMKDFLQKLRSFDLRGHFGFAFDTRFDSGFSGSAAKAIEKELERCDVEMIAPRESAFVLRRQKSEKGSVKLKDAEEERFEKMGSSIGSALRDKTIRKQILI
jgi:flavodoxin